MIGLLHIDKTGLRTDEDGNLYVIARVNPESRYNAKSIVQELQQSQKEVTITFDYKKNHRTLDQNALLWALLTIYANALGGDETPEEQYYKMLNRYGQAQFLVMQEETVPALKALYRDVKVIDDVVIVREGKRTPAKIVKCIVGSSQYDTSQMAQLIDGIFNELAAMDIDAHASREVATHYDEWRAYKGGL